MELSPSSSVGAIEQELTEAQRYFLRDACATQGLDPDGWYDVSSLRQIGETLALVRCANRLQIQDRCSRERAELVAGVRLDLNDATVRMRVYRASLNQRSA